MSQNLIADKEVVKLPLKTLGLRSGMSIQTRKLGAGAEKKERQFFGAIEGKGVMVSNINTDSGEVEFEVGDSCLVSGFTGQFEFTFLTRVVQTFDKPFVYALLEYPALSDARRVRQSMRMQTEFPASARLTENPDHSDEVNVTILDISDTGALIKTPIVFGEIGDHIYVTMCTEIDNERSEITLQSRICHTRLAATQDAHLIGLAFKNVKSHDKMVLHFLTRV